MRQLKINKSITNRDNVTLDKYLQEIGHEELVSVDEEVELARRIHNGDRKALERLVKANLRFVVSVAKQYQNQGLSLPDLINEGNVGLIKAAEKFDETRGFMTLETLVTIAATISEPPDVPLWMYVVPRPIPQAIPPRTMLIAVSSISGGWEMK